MLLREIAHSRAGDKGDVSNLSLIVYNRRDYPFVLEYVTADRVKAHFDGMVFGDVTRFELPNLYALNFVMKKALGGGVTRSLAIDLHGKCLSSYLLAMEVPEPMLDL